jgi:Gas vesicle synthesis protein GvpL/GvpF
MPAERSPEPQPVYVYGVVPGGTGLSLAVSGVAGRPLELVEHDGVAAVVSELPPGDLRVRRRDLDAHLRSLEQIFDQTTVAPCSFATVMESRQDVERELLAARREELKALLRRLDGHVQMNVKAEYDEETVIRRVLAEEPEIARARERTRALGDAAYFDNIRLGELVSGALAVRRASDAERIAARLVPAAADSVVEPTEGELLVFKGSFLVARDGLPAFDAELDSLAAGESGGLRFESFGPLPPTAFANLGPEG